MRPYRNGGFATEGSGSQSKPRSRSGEHHPRWKAALSDAQNSSASPKMFKTI